MWPEALADIREEENTRGLGNWMGKSRRPWGEKGKVVWPEALAGVRWESDGRSRLTVGQVKTER